MLKIGNFTIYENQIVYNERDPVAGTITLHFVSGETLEFTDSDTVAVLVQYFEDQALNINI